MEAAVADSSNGSEETFILRKRGRYERGYTITDNQLLQDTKRLSYRAIGVASHLWSLPEGARINSTQLAQRGREGRDAIRTALNELAAAGYLKREARRGERGRWITHITLADRPMDKSPGGTGDGFPGAGESGVGQPGAQNQRTNGKGLPASASNEADGGGATDGRSDTIVGKAIEALGFAPVERGAFAKIITEAAKTVSSEDLLLRAVREWGKAGEPVSFLTGRIGTMDREARARGRRNGNDGQASQVRHDGKHDPACWCYDVPEDQRAKVHRGDLLRAAGLEPGQPVSEGLGVTPE